MKNMIKNSWKKFAVYLMLGGLLLLAACSTSNISPQTPPTIIYGEDVCDYCGMIISEERFAAAIVIQTESQQYEYRIFDDIGDMFAFVQESEQHGETFKVVSYFVHDYVDSTWLDAQEAHFVQTATLRTPMGSGLAAFASQAAAEEQAQAWDTAVLDFEGASAHATVMHSHADH